MHAHLDSLHPLTGASTVRAALDRGALLASLCLVALSTPGCRRYQSVDARPAEQCPALGEPQAIATLQHESLPEISGLVHDRRTPFPSQPPNVTGAARLWVHNDSGDLARYFTLDGEGHVVGVAQLAGVEAIDFEDAAWIADARPWMTDAQLRAAPVAFPGLLLADVGDNRRERARLRVHVVPMAPAPDTAAHDAPSARASLPPLVSYELELRTADDAPIKENVEAVVVDPLDGALWLFSKRSLSSTPYRVAAPSAADTTSLLGVAKPAIELPSRDATAADISVDGDTLALRTYEHLLVWSRPGGAGLDTALQTPPCVYPLDAGEPQGEALALAPHGDALLTTSERVGQPLWRWSLGAEKTLKNTVLISDY